MWKRLSEHGLMRLAVPAVTMTLLKLQSLYFHHKMLGRTSEVDEPRLENCLLFLLVPILAALPKTLRYLSCTLALVVSTALLEIDALYYRFFKDLPSLHLLPAWKQAGKTAQSISDFLERKDGVLLEAWIVLAVVMLVCWRWDKKEAKLSLPLGVLVLSVSTTVYIWHDLHRVRYEQLQRRFQNVAVGKVFGPLFYHAYDVWEWGRVELGMEGTARFDLEKVRELVTQSRESALQETPFKGLYQGRDLIFVQLESLEYFTLNAEHEGEPIMPFLQSAGQTGFAFKLLDQTHLGRSADGEFLFLNSLHPPAARALPFVYPNNAYYGLPALFNQKGYQTTYFHASDPSFWNTALLANAYGFQESLFKKDLPAEDRAVDIRGWGLTDRALFKKVTKKLEETTKPAFFYVVTMMCHHPYSETKSSDVDFPPAKTTSMVRRYLRCARLRDDSIRDFVKDLAKTERGRRAVLCLIGDHEANLSKAECNRLGLPVFPEREAVPAVIFSVESVLDESPALDGAKPDASFGGQIDIAPSLGHVFSLNMEESVFLGWNLFGKQNNKPRLSRVGPWMDRNGTIKQSESAPEMLDTSCFEVSEMLLQGDRIQEVRHSL